MINVIGMGVALAAAMILMVQVRWDTTYNKNFEGHERVFRMENNWIDQGLFSTHISRPFIETARDASPNIEAVGTISDQGNQIFYREGDKESAITIPAVLVDSAMFSVFPFEWVEGSAKDFTVPGNAVLNETFAKMIFGEESAIGKTLHTGDISSRIIGVFKNTPRNYSMHCGIIANIGDNNLEEFSEWSYGSFFKLKDPSLAKETEDAIYTALKEYISSDEETQVESRKGFRISQIHDAHFERDVKADVSSANKAITITLAAIAILLILIAIINFIKFAFAEIPFRIKNINTRKVLGEGRGSLIGRQLAHAGLIALAAFGVRNTRPDPLRGIGLCGCGWNRPCDVFHVATCRTSAERLLRDKRQGTRLEKRPGCGPVRAVFHIHNYGLICVGPDKVYDPQGHGLQPSKGSPGLVRLSRRRSA